MKNLLVLVFFAALYSAVANSAERGITINTSHVEYRTDEILLDNEPVIKSPVDFKIEIDGVITGGFKTFSGLESETEVVEFKDGDDAITHKRAGKAKYKNITLKREITPGKEDKILMLWRKEMQAGKISPRDITVTVIDDVENDKGFTEKLTGCIPVKWMAPEVIEQRKEFSSYVEIIELVNCKSAGRHRYIGTVTIVK